MLLSSPSLYWVFISPVWPSLCCSHCEHTHVTCALTGWENNSLVARLWGVGVETVKGLLGDGSQAIPRTGGWGRELVIEATPAACQAHTHIPNSLRNTTFTSTPPVALYYTHTLALLILPLLLLFSGNMTWSKPYLSGQQVQIKEQWTT